MTVSIPEPSGSQLAPANLDQRLAYARTLAASNLLPRQYREQPANVLIAIELGDALGIRPIIAMQTVHVIEGTPTQSSNLMATLVRRAGHKLRVQTDDAALVAKATLIRHDDPDFAFEAVWTMAKATKAGLAGKDNWKKNPGAMLRARAISEVCRSGAAECLLGVEYTADEAEDFTVPASVGVITATVAPARDWRAEVDTMRGDYESLKALHGEAHRAGAFRGDPALRDYFQAAKTLPEPGREVIDVETGEVVDAVIVEPEPEFEAAPAPAEAPSAPARPKLAAKQATLASIVRELERCGIDKTTVDAYLPVLGVPRDRLADLTQDEAVDLLDMVRGLDRDMLAGLAADAAGRGEG